MNLSATEGKCKLSGNLITKFIVMKIALIIPVILLSVEISLCQEGRSFNKEETIEYLQNLFRKDNVYIKEGDYMPFGSYKMRFPYINITESGINLHIHSTWMDTKLEYRYSFNEKEINIKRIKRIIRIECLSSSNDCIRRLAYDTNLYYSFIELGFASEKNAQYFLNSFNHLKSILLEDSNRNKSKNPFDY